MFADDIVLFTTDPLNLQAQIDRIQLYSERWGLEINVNKTKVCFFEKRKSTHNVSFEINGESIETVDNFTYLSVGFNYTGNFNIAIKCLYGQALKAYNSLLSLLHRFNLDGKTTYQSLIQWLYRYCYKGLKYGGSKPQKY